MPINKTAKNVGEPTISRYDDRTGLGYGLTRNRFHSPRLAQGTYPYKVDSLDDTEFDDEESRAAINKKVVSLYINDPMAAASTDPFYFAAGNTKLSDCFFRIEKVLKEIATFSDSMAPIPANSRPSPPMSGGSSIGMPPNSGNANSGGMAQPPSSGGNPYSASTTNPFSAQPPRSTGYIASTTNNNGGPNSYQNPAAMNGVFILTEVSVSGELTFERSSDLNTMFIISSGFSCSSIGTIAFCITTLLLNGILRKSLNCSNCQ